MDDIQILVVWASLKYVSRMLDSGLTFLGCRRIWLSVRGTPIKSVTLRSSGDMMLNVSWAV